MNDRIHQVIRASAGTGKTFRLSSRYLRLLDGDATPRDILATTFTRKAAGEILERVLQRLAAAAFDEDGARKLAKELGNAHLTLSRCRQLLAILCRSLHNVSIGTIDSLFSRMAACFAFELDIPPDAAVVASDDPRAAQLRQDAIENLLSDETPEILLDLLRRLHHDQARRSVTGSLDRIVNDLYETWRQSDARVWARMAEVAQLPKDEVAQAIAKLGDVASRITAKGIAQALRNNYEAAVNHDWDKFMESGLAPKVAAAGPGHDVFFGNRKAPVPGEVVAALAPLVAYTRACQINAVARRTRALCELLTKFDVHYSHLRNENKLMLFADLPLRLAGFVPMRDEANLAEIYFRMDAQVHHLLLDEFQDTSPMQWRVLHPFAEQIVSTGDVDYAADVRGAERSFFCVGDMKQAIYGWRGGCAEIFARVEDDLQLPAGAGETLSHSYRSAQAVLDTVNVVFTAVTTRLPLVDYAAALDDWATAFEPHTAAHAEQPGRVELHTSLSAEAVNGENDDDNDEQEPASAATPHQAWTAEAIAALHRAHPQRSIGVLVRTNRAVNAYIYQLRQRHVQASGEGGNPVTDDPAVNVVLSALTLADHPGNTAALFHVRHSPLAGILAKDLGVDLADDALVPAVARMMRRDILARGYAAVITRWARGLAGFCDQRNAVRLGQLVELADRYDPALTLRCRDFVEFVEATTVEEPASAPVRVMTIHKSKGLEFDIVVLPELQPQIGRPPTKGVWVHRPGPTEAPDAIFASEDEKTRELIAAHEPLYEEAYQQERVRRLLDDLCALYVAMTRARHALHMYVPPLDKNKNGLRGAPGWTNLSMATILRRALVRAADETFAGDQLLYEHGDRDWDDAPIAATTTAPTGTGATRRVQLPQPPGGKSRRSWLRVAPSALEAGGVVRADDLLSLQTADGRQFGRVMHKWFEQVTWLDGGDDAPAEDTLLAAALAMDDTLDRAWLDGLLARLAAMLARPAVAAALARPAAVDNELELWRELQLSQEIELWREHEFVVHADGRLLRGVFDRVMIFRTGGQAQRAELIDFKTDRVDEDHGNLQALVEQYRPQMAAYRGALASMLGLAENQVECKLLFVGAGICRTV